jgi:N-acetylmuramoyl-L-alanine amidase
MGISPIVLLQQRASLRPPLPPVPDIAWIGTENYWSGWAGHEPIAVVIHTMEGFLEGTDSHFNDPNVPDSKKVSAHFGVALDGRVHQYVKLEHRAWANGILEEGNTWWYDPDVNPNSVTVSIETEDRRVNSTPVSDALYMSVAGLLRLILATHPSIKYLTSHHVISPVNKKDCCGQRWTEPGAAGGISRLAQLGRAAGLDVRV